VHFSTATTDVRSSAAVNARSGCSTSLGEADFWSAVKRGSPRVWCRSKNILLDWLRTTAVQCSCQARSEWTSHKCLQAPNAILVCSDCDRSRGGRITFFLIALHSACVVAVLMPPRLSECVWECVCLDPCRSISPASRLPPFLSLRRNLPKQAHSRATENICEVVTQRHIPISTLDYVLQRRAGRQQRADRSRGRSRCPTFA
jgi:hypothetical protein